MAGRDLRDRVMVITGASAGIGAATARLCARAGLRVVLAARREVRLQQLTAEINAAGGRTLGIVCDVDRDADVQRLVERTLEAFGRLDIFFANAGHGLFAPVLQTTDQQVRAIFETNYFGTIRCVNAAVPAMRRNAGARGKGHLLICSSAASEFGIPMYGHYAATKAAQDAVAGALRAELADEGIDVTTVHPIGTRTDFFTTAGKLGKLSTGYNTPDTFMHTPEQVARAILRCLRRPCPEVWPSVAARFGLALTTAFPRLGALVARKLQHHHLRQQAKLPQDALDHARQANT